MKLHSTWYWTSNSNIFLDLGMITLYFDYILKVVVIVQREQLNTSHVVSIIKLMFSKNEKIIS
jgi:hypothetical protein